MSFLQREYQLLSRGLSIVFSRFHYVFLAIFLALVMSYLFFRISSLPGQTLQSWNYSITDATRWFVVIYSVLMGFLLAVQLYTLRHVGFHLAKAGKTAAGVIPGLFSGVVAIACCAPAIAGVAALIGAGAVGFISVHETLFVVPSVLLIAASLHYSLRAIAAPTCNFKSFN